MTRRLAALVLVGFGLGCSGPAMPPARTPADAQFFSPATMHLSPVFTKVTDFDSDGSADGLEAVIELQDRFGDPTKAAGRIVFQVYQHRPYNPDPRGPRVAGPFEGRVDSVQDQRNRWSRVNRAYIFQLAFPNASANSDYVLEAMFESTNGGRLFDRLLLEGDRERPAATTGPSPLAGSTPSAGGAIVTQEALRVPTASQPHEPPARADAP